MSLAISVIFFTGIVFGFDVKKPQKMAAFGLIGRNLGQQV